jgi:hypothetical protein
MCKEAGAVQSAFAKFRFTMLEPDDDSSITEAMPAQPQMLLPAPRPAAPRRETTLARPSNGSAPLPHSQTRFCFDENSGSAEAHSGEAFRHNDLRRLPDDRLESANVFSDPDKAPCRGALLDPWSTPHLEESF